MYKILFVDDERSVLEYLPLAINWESLGITQKYAAEDARTALRIVKKEMPDIAIVDVEMPEIDGLEFCRKAQKIHPQIKIVILSAFDRFDYARRAIVIGVDDYLLKPVDEEELEKLMRQMVHDLAKIRKDSEENLLMQMSVLEKETGELIKNMLNQKLPDRKLEEIFPLLNDCGNICMIMQGNTDLQRCREDLKKYIDEEELVISPAEGFYIVLWKDDILISMEQKTDDICRALKKEGLCAKVSYVRIRKEEKFTEALIRCFYEMERLFYQSYKKRRPGDDVEFSHMGVQRPDFTEGLHLLSEEGDISIFQETLRQAMTEAFERYEEPVEICGMILDAFIFLKIYLTKYWQEEAIDIFRQLDISTLFRCDSPENLYETVRRYMEELQLFVRRQKKNHGNAYVVKIAKEYTREHYQDKELSLQEVSNAVGLSRTYFSKAFKEMTGEKYWDYLSAYRIEKAKELLCSTNLGQAEISEKVGYGSEFHFSRKFKEIVGISPNKFRRRES